jgi:nucleoside-diphosphate-sugar epimerase
MRVFVAGATGVIGRRLVPELVRRGHEVVGTTRTAAKVERLRDLGGEPVVLDALDEAAVKDAVVTAEPDVVVHQLTAIPDEVNPRHLDREFAETNRLRTEGTDHLLAAARTVGARRFVAQSFAMWAYARTGGPIKTEDDPIESNPPASVRQTLASLVHVERALEVATDLDGIALRYGIFYGPGTSIGEGGPVLDAIRKRRFPIVGRGTGTWSFIHIADAATATADAVEGGATGVYNVADDEPASVAEWLPVLAEALGAPRPRTMPAWLARPLIGEAGIAMMNEVRGASNTKVKRELDWRPWYASWRDGFRFGLE